MNTFIKNNSLWLDKITSQYTYNPNNLVLLYNTGLGNGVNTIYVPVQGTSPNITIDWGDGLSDTYTTIGYKSHTYATSGTYVVQISGTMRTLSHSATIPVIGSKEKLIQCLSFGNIGLTSLAGAFLGCLNLISVPDLLPTTSTITNLVSVFESCSIFNQPLDNWNISNVTTMSRMFFTATNFNQSLSTWNVGRVTNFGSMFANASLFNGDLSGWNIGANVATPSINMGYIFYTSGFNNSSIVNWNTNKVTNLTGAFGDSGFNQNINNWDVSNVTVMTAVFSSAYNFNQPLNNWNTSKVTNFSNIFYNADSFNQNLASWNLSGITAANGLNGFMRLATGLSTANYDSLLIGWNANKASYRIDLSPNFGGSKYSAAGASARAALIAYGWTITDGGLAP